MPTYDVSWPKVSEDQKTNEYQPQIIFSSYISFITALKAKYPRSLYFEDIRCKTRLYRTYQPHIDRSKFGLLCGAARPPSTRFRQVFGTAPRSRC